jgi:hypothetical protein
MFLTQLYWIKDDDIAWKGLNTDIDTYEIGTRLVI